MREGVYIGYIGFINAKKLKKLVYQIPQLLFKGLLLILIRRAHVVFGVKSLRPSSSTVIVTHSHDLFLHVFGFFYHAFHKIINKSIILHGVLTPFFKLG